MDINSTNNNTLAHHIQDLSITDNQNVPMMPEGVNGRGVSSENAMELDDDGVNGSRQFVGRNEAIEATSNGIRGLDSNNSEAGTADHMASSNKEGNTNGIPDIHINGEPEEDHVNMDIIGPEDEDDGDVGTLVAHDHAGIGQKSKKKKKPKSKRGLSAPTGFEEYYVDAPLTPAEHAEEKGMYDSSIPFRERIEIAIQRFFAKRNLNSERKDAFDKWLAFGGVDSGQKMFSGGLDAKTLSDSTAPEIATLTAKHSVGQDKNDSGDSAFVVDFDGVVRAFLSTQLPIHFDLRDENAIKMRVGVIRNFLNYLLHHDVCPEYNEQVYAARDTCNLADKELWLAVQASRLLPGKFNTACSEIFGGCLQGMYIGDKDWAKGFVSSGPGISAQLAPKTFKAGLIARASQENLKLFKKQDDANKIKIMSEIETGLEVTELVPAEEEVLDFYQSEHAEGLKPLGCLRVKTWYCPEAPEDLTEEEETAAATAPKDIKEYEFWVEDEVLAKCFLGMKIITIVKELSFGVLYFDSIEGIYCSFYTELPNEDMLGWREPETTWLPMREKVGSEDMEDDGADDDGMSVANEDIPAGGAITTEAS